MSGQLRIKRRLPTASAHASSMRLDGASSVGRRTVIPVASVEGHLLAHSRANGVRTPDPFPTLSFMPSLVRCAAKSGHPAGKHNARISLPLGDAALPLNPRILWLSKDSLGSLPASRN